MCDYSRRFCVRRFLRSPDTQEEQKRDAAEVKPPLSRHVFSGIVRRALDVTVFGLSLLIKFLLLSSLNHPAFFVAPV